jgi:ubiquinone/menaquinone biosynthesis C-methylase UbiE
MDKPMSNLHFNVMSFGYTFRDFFLTRKSVLKEVRIQQGFHVLDYGCGPGGYVIAAAALAGTSGRIYALDIHPLAIQKVKDIVANKQLINVETILSDRKTGLPGESIDVVLLLDVFHSLSNPDGVLKELHRVLKPKGILFFSDHHMKEAEIVARITKGKLFRLSRKGKKTYSFLKEG